MKFKNNAVIFALLIAFVFAGSGYAQTILAEQWATKAKILSQYGKPVLEDRRQELVSKPDGTVVSVTVDEWTYDEPNLHATFVFRNGRWPISSGIEIPLRRLNDR